VLLYIEINLTLIANLIVSCS